MRALASQPQATHTSVRGLITGIHFELLRQAVQAVQSGVITAFGLRRRQVNDAGPFRARFSTPDLFAPARRLLFLCPVLLSVSVLL